MTRPDHIYGFNYLRASLSVAVVAIHTKLFGTLNTFQADNRVEHAITASDLMYLIGLSLAVPTFFLISLFLLCARAEGNRYYYSCMLKVAGLYLLWMCLLVLFPWGSVQLPAEFSLKSVTLFVVAGGHTPFYFFFLCCS